MGIVNFAKWIFDRYPLASQYMESSKLPEFDNLYLDMNCVLHRCTDVADDDAVGISETDMLAAIFNYLELVFNKIQPKKVLFMAFDGVAPRAKMNQQRSRRFRDMMYANIAKEKALKEGSLPFNQPYDSNLFKPGTQFMSKLSKNLNLFIFKKVNEDYRWRHIEIIISGHDVPGEGEHKLMEYIRKSKLQPDYNPNTRHCLYGVDADLIVLGLLTHEPHLTILRERAKFIQVKERPADFYNQKFYLLHLSLFREYLELEFRDVNCHLSFKLDFERVLDDFVLLCIFVGNDFLPNLPQLEIHLGALTYVLEAYKLSLRRCDTYLTEFGNVNLLNLRRFLEELEFKMPRTDNEYQLRLNAELQNSHALPSTLRNMEMTDTQKTLLNSVTDYFLKSKEDHSLEFQIPLRLVENDLEFIKKAASILSICCSIEVSADGNVLSLTTSPENSTIQTEFLQEGILQDDAGHFNEFSFVSTEKVVRNANNWKDNYYKEKLGFLSNDEVKMTMLCENYVQGLQWILNYYYKGVCSWSWYFKYYYSPMVSDIYKGLGADLNFLLGQPFLPFEQLMCISPMLYSELIPIPYRKLMFDVSSPIADFYPLKVEVDLNGKKDWEAVVKIPFVDEDRLLTAMKPLEAELTSDEQGRNLFGSMLKYTYSLDLDDVRVSSTTFLFPGVERNKCSVEEYSFPDTNGVQYSGFLCKGVRLGRLAPPGFPTLQNILHGTDIVRKKSEFQADSWREVVTINVNNIYNDVTAAEIAIKNLGRKVYVNWPYLSEARIEAVVSRTFSYNLVKVNRKNEIIFRPHDARQIQNFDFAVRGVRKRYENKGVNLDDVTLLLSVALISGLKQVISGSFLKEYETGSNLFYQYPVQAMIESIPNEDGRFKEILDPQISQVFGVEKIGFYLGQEGFGRPLRFANKRDDRRADVLALEPQMQNISFGNTLAQQEHKQANYLPTNVVSRKLRISAYLLSKITSSYFVQYGDDNATANVGLSLKFEAKGLKVHGYTRRIDKGWEYSSKAVDLIQAYMLAFPDLSRGLSRAPRDDSMNILQLLNVDEAIARPRLDEILRWLEVHVSSLLSRVPLGFEQLLPKTVGVIEQYVDRHTTKLLEPMKLENVSQKLILRPTDGIYKLRQQRFSLGDRVQYVCEVGNVPIGTPGTVIGITFNNRHKALEVVFDECFFGGSDFDGRCSVGRGMTIDVSSVINLTTKQLAC
ncbi:XRN 5'-3' exonuclease N-terminus-domain-containing protein [Lipomyces arxii]|uniref:XRN 5'-3' exonuclease N-terminus-domain-containing protein n=1 Tax=Lipomyces arxii TaxID=56418 RepID=UPI0034CFB2F2